MTYVLGVAAEHYLTTHRFPGMLTRVIAHQKKISPLQNAIVEMTCFLLNGHVFSEEVCTPWDKLMDAFLRQDVLNYNGWFLHHRLFEIIRPEGSE